MNIIRRLLFFSRWKIFFWSSLILLFVFFIFFNQPTPGIIFFDVGQGDAALLNLDGGRKILIDGGPDNQVLLGLGKHLAFFQRRLDYVIFSHYHADHIVGLIEVLQRYQVGQLLYLPTSYESADLDLLLMSAQERGIKLQPLVAQGEIKLGKDCFISLLNPEALGISKDENNSLTVRLQCQGLTALLAGDSDIRAERAILQTSWSVAADIFKLSHHGSKTANSEEFLKSVVPQMAIVSAGAGNLFGHPHPEVLARLAELGIVVRRTDQEGDIKISFP